MAKKKSRSRRRASFTVPVAVVGGFAPLALNMVKDYQDGGINVLGQGLILRTTGYNMGTQKFMPEYLMQGTGAIVLGVLVHKIASALGINRALASARIPFLRI